MPRPRKNPAPPALKTPESWSFWFPEVVTPEDKERVSCFLERLNDLVEGADILTEYGRGLYIASAAPDVIDMLKKLAPARVQERYRKDSEGRTIVEFPHMEGRMVDSVLELANAAAGLKQAEVVYEHFTVIQCNTRSPLIAEILRKFAKPL